MNSLLKKEPYREHMVELLPSMDMQDRRMVTVMVFVMSVYSVTGFQHPHAQHKNLNLRDKVSSTPGYRGSSNIVGEIGRDRNSLRRAP